jgi:hypothetical protein
MIHHADAGNGAQERAGLAEPAPSSCSHVTDVQVPPRAGDSLLLAMRGRLLRRRCSRGRSSYVGRETVRERERERERGSSSDSLTCLTCASSGGSPFSTASEGRRCRAKFAVDNPGSHRLRYEAEREKRAESSVDRLARSLLSLFVKSQRVITERVYAIGERRFQC